jgi:hypothetical protein
MEILPYPVPGDRDEGNTFPMSPKNFKESELFQRVGGALDEEEKPCYHIKHINYTK